MKSTSSKLAMKIRRKKNQTRRNKVKKVGSRKNNKRNSKGMKKQKRKSRKYLRKRVLKSLGGLPVELKIYDPTIPDCEYYNVQYHNVEHAKKTSDIAEVIAQKAGYDETAAKLAELAGAWHDVMHPGVTNHGVKALKDYINDVKLPVQSGNLLDAVNTFKEWVTGENWVAPEEFKLADLISLTKYGELPLEYDFEGFTKQQYGILEKFHACTALKKGVSVEICKAILLTDMSKWYPFEKTEQRKFINSYGFKNLGVILHMGDIGTYGYYGETNADETRTADWKDIVINSSVNCMIEFVYEAGMYKKLGIELTQINPTVRDAYNHMFYNEGQSDLDFFRNGQVSFIEKILSPKYEAYAEVADVGSVLKELMNKFVNNAKANADMLKTVSEDDITDFTAAISQVKVWCG